MLSGSGSVTAGDGYGGWKFFSKMNAVVIVGGVNAIRTTTASLGSDGIGFAQAYGVGIPKAETLYAPYYNGKWNTATNSNTLSIMTPFGTLAPVASSVTFVNILPSDFKAKSVIFGTCYGQITTIENAKKFIFNTITTLFWNPKTGATQTDNIIKY